MTGKGAMPKLPQVLPLVVAAVFAALAPSTGVLAETASTRFRVTAQVAPRVTLHAHSQVQSLSVSAADLERGELELELGYQVASNDPRGFVLELAPRRGLAEIVTVDIDGTQADLTDSQLEFLQRDCGRCEVRIRYRVRLRAGLSPGEYPLPWQLRARPI
jgi:hypothetical protein